MKVKVDLCAIVQNCKVVESALQGASICAVVKNNAYGHGIEHVCRALVPHVSMFAVANVAEANKIASFGKPVLLLLPQFGNHLQIAVDKGYVLTVDSLETFHKIANCVGKKKVHLKINTGMNRLGLNKEQVEHICKLASQHNVEVQGVFSHLAKTDLESCNRQLANFLPIARKCKQAFGKHILCHIANSSATFLHPKFHLDMVRVGLALYGYGNKYLVPAKTVTAKVIATRVVEKGQPVGYDGAFVARQTTKIAILDVGYADGLARILAGSFVKFGNSFCKIVGNVCMGMCFVDVSNAKISVGDEAILLGKGCNLANNDVSAYELLCNFSNCCKI